MMTRSDWSKRSGTNKNSIQSALFFSTSPPHDVGIHYSNMKTFFVMCSVSKAILKQKVMDPWAMLHRSHSEKGFNDILVLAANKLKIHKVRCYIDIGGKNVYSAI